LPAVAAGLLVPGCRGTDELVASIGAHVVVVVDDDDEQVVQLDIADLQVRGAAVDGSNVVSFALPLDPGEHQGAATIFRVEDDGLRPDRCGPFVVRVVDGAPPPTVALVADDLPGCDDDDVDGADGVEGEGEVDEDGAEDAEDADPEEPNPDDDGT
jgi:hypothetical protein